MVLSTFLSSCATLLKDKKEITIDTQSKDAEVFVKDESIGKGKKIKYTANGSFEYVVKTEGCEDLHGIIYPTRVSPWFHLTVLSGLFFNSDKDRFQFLDNYELKKQRKLIPRQTDQHYLDFKNVAFKVEKGNYDVFRQSLKRYLEYKEPFKSFNLGLSNSKSPYAVDLKQTIFDTELNKFCKELNFIDTTGAFLSSRYNSLSMEVTVDDIDFLIVKVNSSTGFFETTLAAKWKVVNAIGEEIYTHTSRSTSGKFNVNGNRTNTEARINNSVTDAFRHAFLDLLETESFQDLLNKPIEDEGLEELKISKPVKTASSLEEATKACVTVKVDKGHGSGFFINNDGYILTNYHVIQEGEKIEVIIDSKKYPVTVIQSAKFADLAVLKVDYKSEYALSITNVREGALGDEVFAIGTPSSTELPATISKGIISGFRNAGGEYDLLQTDVSINFGNSGGPLVDRNSKLFGIVNSKLAGFGVEGISFGLSNEYIASELNLVFVD